MQTICYNSIMSWQHRQLMRPFPTATSLVVAAPHRCAANSLCGSAALRDENSSRTSRTLREIKTTTYIWDDWNIIREIQWPVTSDQWSVGTLATGHCPLVTDYVWGLDLDGTLRASAFASAASGLFL